MKIKINTWPILFFTVLIVMTISCRKENEMVLNGNEAENNLSQGKRVCGAIEFNNALARSRMEEMEQVVQQHIAENAGANLRTSVVVIPVVFHVVYNLPEQNISDLQLQSQIDVLNEDFNAANADMANVPACFQSLIGNAHLQFVLAQRDPNGDATNGITRTSTALTSFSSDGSVCQNAMGGCDAWSTSQYLNIWVCNKSGAAGYSSYPWSGNPATDGIIAGYNFIGRTGTFTNNWNYQKGRTITHEVGHWLGLVHIWGDAVCGDDLVDDTPSQSAANGSVPVFPHVSPCSPNTNGDLFMNYMDYTYDATRIMFSNAQVIRMNSYLDVTRASIEASLGGVPPEGSCNAPSGLNITSITANSGMLSWTSTGAMSYGIKYKPTPSASWITATTTASSLGISGLSASTSYEFQVQSICSTGSSVYSPSTIFITSPIITSCDVPTGLIASLITSSGATLSWNANGAISYNIRYKTTSSNSWITASSSSTSLIVSGLSSHTNYEFQVQSICSGGTSSYSPSQTFMTKRQVGHLRLS